VKRRREKGVEKGRKERRGREGIGRKQSGNKFQDAALNLPNRSECPLSVVLRCRGYRQCLAR